MKRQLTEPPVAMAINVPETYFTEGEGMLKRRRAFEQYYEAMGTEVLPDGCFYHFIGNIPVHDLLDVYVCYLGFVRYRARIAGFIRNGHAPYPDSPKRNYIITTGPVVKAPDGLVMRGFRNFRYCQHLF